MTNEKVRYILSGLKLSGMEAEARDIAMNEMKEAKKPVTKIITEVINEFCEHYCKWPEACLNQYKDADDAEEHLQYEHCSGCPFEMLD